MLSDRIVRICRRVIVSRCCPFGVVWEEVGLLVDGLNMADFADAWTKQAGFPVVDVEKLGNNTYRLTQERYLLKGLGKGKRNDQLWSIHPPV